MIFAADEAVNVSYMNLEIEAGQRRQTVSWVTATLQLKPSQTASSDHPHADKATVLHMGMYGKCLYIQVDVHVYICHEHFGIIKLCRCVCTVRYCV